MRIIREGPTKITRSTIDAAWRRRAAGLRTVIGDFECRGLALIVNATSMSWVYSYKPRGVDPSTGKRFATKSITIGNPETHSPDHARTAANELKGRAKAGFDPAADRKAGIERGRRSARTHGGQAGRGVCKGSSLPSAASRPRTHLKLVCEGGNLARPRGGRGDGGGPQADQGRRRRRHPQAFARRSRASQRGSPPFRGYPAILRLVSRRRDAARPTHAPRSRKLAGRARPRRGRIACQCRN